MPSRFILLLSLTSLLLFSILLTPALSKTPTPSDAADDDDEDLSFLEADDENDAASKHSSQNHHFKDDDDDDTYDDDEESYGDFEIPSNFDHGDEEENEGVELIPKVDEKDVVVLTEGNFSDFIESNKYVMVEFYAPWCGHCKALAPEYAAAATELKKLEGEKVALAKVDATEENELAENYEVQGFPTVFFFVDGEHKPYTGQRSK